MITEIFGENCSRAKVFDLLLSHPNTEYTKTDIAECSEIAKGTLNKFIGKLVEYEIIKPTRRIGNGQLYQINMDSTITQALNSFQNQLADIEFEKEMKECEEELEENIKIIRPFEEIVKKEHIKFTVNIKDTPYFRSIMKKSHEETVKNMVLKPPNYRPMMYNLGQTSSKGNRNLLSKNSTEIKMDV